MPIGASAVTDPPTDRPTNRPTNRPSDCTGENYLGQVSANGVSKDFFLSGYDGNPRFLTAVMAGVPGCVCVECVVLSSHAAHTGP